MPEPRRSDRGQNQSSAQTYHPSHPKSWIPALPFLGDPDQDWDIKVNPYSLNAVLGSHQRQSQVAGAVSRRDPAARIAGVLLVLTAVVTAVSALGRVAADADQPTLAETLSPISLKSGIYGLGGAARFVAGVTLVAAAWYLLRTWIIRERLGTPLVPALFAVSGAFTIVSGVCAVILAVSAPEVSPLIESSAFLRWLTGKIGFAIAGLGLVVAARYQRRVGGALRYIAPMSAIIGVAMQFIWIDAATMVHPIVGAAFFIWLLGVGAMLFSGKTEKLFSQMGNSDS